jgi:hypothetical protein
VSTNVLRPNNIKKDSRDESTQTRKQEESGPHSPHQANRAQVERIQLIQQQEKLATEFKLSQEAVL